MIYTFFTLYFLIISALLGYLEAIMFSIMDIKKKEGFEARRGDIHTDLTGIRSVIWIISALGISVLTGNFYTFLTVVPCVLMFPFIHDGFYYYSRHKIDGSYHGFTDTSVTTTAKTSLTFSGRLTAALFGLVALIVMEVYL